MSFRESLRDEILRNGEITLQRLIDEQQQETVNLDFKADDPNKRMFAGGQVTKHGRAVFAKALSAFANSAGGLVVYGIDCRKNDDDVDCACSRVPIAKFEAIASSLDHTAGNLVQPSIESVGIHAIQSSTPDYGYIVIDIPRSERRPHRSEASGQKQYFKRSGSSSIEMEHFDIEDAFRRVGSPDLDVSVEFVSSGSIGKRGGEREFHFRINVLAENTGTASAKHISFMYPMKNQFRLRPHDWHEKPPQNMRQAGGWFYIPSDVSLVIHPGQKIPVTGLFTTVIKLKHGKIQLAEEKAELSDFCVPYQLAAENMRIKTGKIDIGGIVELVS